MRLGNGFGSRILHAVILALVAVPLLGGCGGSDEKIVGTYELAGTAVLEDQQDHSGITIKILELQNGNTVITQADGSFTLPALSDGDWTLKASRDFYSTLTMRLNVRGGLLVDPIGRLELKRTFFISIRSDSLNYGFRSDSVKIWMTLVNDDVEQLDLYHSLARPYDFVIFDPAVSDSEIVWQWSRVPRPWINEEREDFAETIAAKDSLELYPHRAWDKKNLDDYRVEEGRYLLQGWLELRDSRGRFWEFRSKKRSIWLVPE